MVPSLAQIIEDPDWICFGLNPDDMSLHFAHVGEEAMEENVFLSHHRLESAPSASFTLSAVAETMVGTSIASAPRFVLHTAFCCSTLLARCLNAPGRVKALRELPVFSGLAPVREALLSRGDEAVWPLLVRITGQLASRPFSSGAAAINKPGNVFLPVSADFLRIHTSMRAVVIHSDLPSFLASCVKKQSAGVAPWLQMYAALDPNGSYCKGLGIDPASASALQLACVIWNLQMQLLLGLEGFRDRVVRIESTAFLAAPVNVVRNTQAWLGVNVDEETSASVIAHEMSRHSKKPELAYGPERRAAEASLVAQHFGADIEAAMRWNIGHFGQWQQHYEAFFKAIPALGVA